MANVLLCLAGTHEDCAEYTAAHTRYQHAVQILEQLPENISDHDVQRLRMQAIGGVGNVLRALGRYHEAEPKLKERVAIAERTFGRDDAEVAGALNDLGVLYKYTGDFDKAGRLYRRALKIAEKACYDDPQVATITSQPRRLELRARAVRTRQPFTARRSVAIREERTGRDHPAVAADAAALAAILGAQGKREEAEAIYRRAGDLRAGSATALRGGGHALHNLAALERGEWASRRVRRLCVRALAIRSRCSVPIIPTSP